MEWTTVLLILGILAIVGVLLVGGVVKITQKGISVNTKGLLQHLGAAAVAKGVPAVSQEDIKSVQRQASKLPKKLPRGLVLWVDDHPENNVNERLALATLGIVADSYTENTQAVTAMQRVEYGLVISDIGRGESPETGWDLLREVRKRKPSVPFLFYTLGVDDNLRNRAKQAGASGITQDPGELVSLVINLLGSAA